MKKIIVDVMGADRPAAELVKGAVLAEKEYGANLVLVGDGSQIEKAVADNGGDLSKFTVVHTDSVVTMEDDPMSIRRLRRIHRWEQALKYSPRARTPLSAPETPGRCLQGIPFVRKIADVTRPAIASLIPTKNPVSLDSANVELPRLPTQFE